MQDYRNSHLNKGQDYDRDLARGPFDAYLSQWEAFRLQSWLQQHGHRLPRGILDFACGTGRITQLLSAHATSAQLDTPNPVTGVDISASMLTVARQRCPGVNFIEADLTRAEHAATAAQPAGLITAFRFFGNAQPELREQVLAALVPRLAPEGRLLIDHHRNAGAMYARLDRLTGGSANGMDLTAQGLYALLHAQGLEVELALPIGAWMWRSKLLHAAVTPERARVLEARFAAPFWAAWAPACMVVARHQAER